MRKPLVIKIGGTTLEEQRSNTALWSEIARMGDVVLLHGGGKAVDKVLSALGFTTHRQEGIRITPPDQMQHIAAVLAGSVNKSLVASILASGGRAVGLCLGDGGAIPSQRADHYSFDPGLVGKVLPADKRNNLLTLLLSNGYIPVLSSIGIDAQGQLLNINADDAAAGVAAAIDARAVVLLTDVSGVLDRNKQVIPELNSVSIEALIADGTVTGGMIPKVRAALEAARTAQAPVVILNGNAPDQLQRYLSGEQMGTAVLPN